MNENRLQAYLNLIELLLSCPRGEELAQLQAHQELLDPEFVRVIPEVATQMAANGDRESANFLQELAAFVERMVMAARENRTQAYLNIIEGLLRCPSGEEAEILKANSDFIDDGLVHTMEAVAAMIAEQGNNNANWLQYFASDLAIQLEETSL